MPADSDNASNRITALTFTMGTETYAVDVDGVSEITVLHRITAVPGIPGFIRGIMNLRGRVVPVMDGRERLGLVPQAYHSGTCVLIMEHDAVSVGLVVDEVCDVIELDLDAVEPPPVAMSLGARCLRGLHKTDTAVHLLLDLPLLLAA